MKTDYILNIFFWIAAGIITGAGNICAQDAKSETNSARAEGEFHPDIGQGTNQISARHVKWTDSNGLQMESQVIYDKRTKRVVASNPTGNTCCFNERFLSFLGGAQGITIVEARPANAVAFTTKDAADFAMRNFPAGGEVVKHIDLKSHLKSETKFSAALPILMVESIEPRTKDNTLVVHFEVSKRSKGEVILDTQLNVISVAITPNSNAQK